MIVVKNTLQFDIEATNKELIILIPTELIEKKSEIRRKLNKYYKIWLSPEEFIENKKERSRVYNLFCENYLMEQLNASYHYDFVSIVNKKEI